MKRNLLLALCLMLVIALAVAAGIGWHKRQVLMEAARQWLEARTLAGNAPSQPSGPDAERYEILCDQLARWRGELAARHRSASDSVARAAIEDEARILLEHMLPALMRCWLGTKWDFNGTAAKPGQGKIACGYFVSTVLRDAGLDVNRFRLAQQASSHIIETFLDKDDCTLVLGQDYELFVEEMSQRPPGVYLCGLDTHVAFLVNRSDGFRFIHSSGSAPWAVVDESPEQAGVLQRSQWRMLGNLTADRGFIRTWLGGSKIKVKSS